MIISPGRRYIFAHMPKTGGTSLASALEERAQKDDILIGDTPKALRRKGRLASFTAAGRLWKHSTLADIEGVVTPDKMQEWFVVTLVRNPWDRIVSYYSWARGRSFDHPVVGLAKSLEFEQFAKKPAVLRSLKANPVAAYTTDRRGVDHANLVARLEHLETDLKPLWDHLGFELAIPHLNKSERERDYRSYFDADTHDAVAEVCQGDIETYGYCF